MNKYGHLVTTLLIFLPLWYWTETMKMGYLFIVMCVTLFPDFDLIFDLPHRHILTHSLVIPIMSLLSGVNELQICIILAVSVHLLMDISLRKKGGTYTVKITKRGLNYGWSTFWLFLNGVAGIVIFTIYSVLV